MLSFGFPSRNHWFIPFTQFLTLPFWKLKGVRLRKYEVIFKIPNIFKKTFGKTGQWLKRWQGSLEETGGVHLSET